MSWSPFPIAGLKIGTESIVSAFTANGYTGTDINALQDRARADLSGSMTSGELKTFLSRTGEAGELTFLAYKTNDSTPRTVRFKVTVDGVAVPYDYTSGSLAAPNKGGVICGKFAVVGVDNVGDEIAPIYYRSSILVEYLSSVTETDKLTIYCNRAVYR